MFLSSVFIITLKHLLNVLVVFHQPIETRSPSPIVFASKEWSLRTDADRCLELFKGMALNSQAALLNPILGYIQDLRKRAAVLVPERGQRVSAPRACTDRSLPFQFPSLPFPFHTCLHVHARAFIGGRNKGLSFALVYVLMDAPRRHVSVGMTLDFVFADELALGKSVQYARKVQGIVRQDHGFQLFRVPTKPPFSVAANPEANKRKPQW
jgi:hypothetical protein